jgi:uncharacterized protein YndB with AHSA1/START domain
LFFFATGLLKRNSNQNIRSVGQKDDYMLKIIGIVVVIPIAALLVYAATKPDTFRVERTATIKATPGKIFPYLSDFRKGEAWSPHEKKDPAMKRTYSGATSDKGAVYEFDGDKGVGSGRLEIIDSLPPSKVVISLDMRKPFEGRNIIEYTLEPKGDSTNFTWAMHGPVPYLGKVMCIFVSMDKMIGKDFEAGLANLKAIAEK